MSEAEARELSRQGKAIVHIDGGLHSSEVAGAQQSINLAYKLVSSQNDPEVDAILNNVILMLWPTLNPDGQNEVVAWYRKNLGTTYEVSPLPDLYQEYVGHDNNRDGYMNNMMESQDVTRTEIEWDPVIFYCHHQTAPFPTRIFIPPFVEPISSNIHPLMARWLNVMGNKHGGVPGRARHAWRGESRGLRQLVSGIPGLHAHFPKQHFVFHGDGTFPLRDAAILSGG